MRLEGSSRRLEDKWPSFAEIAALVRRQSFEMIGGIVAVNAVAI